jgi:hypothetical protein
MMRRTSDLSDRAIFWSVGLFVALTLLFTLLGAGDAGATKGLGRLVTPARPDIVLRNPPLKPLELLSHSQQE